MLIVVLKMRLSKIERNTLVMTNKAVKMSEILLNKLSLYKKDEKIVVDINSISHHGINSKIYDYGLDKKRMLELAESIERDGLQQQLVIKKDPEKSGHYICLIGHRRLDALKYLVHEKGFLGYARIECIVKEFKDEDQEIMYMIASNATQRQLTDAERLRQFKYYKSNIDDIRESLGEEVVGVRTIEIIQQQTGMGLAIIRKLNIADKILSGKLETMFLEQLIDLKDVDVINSLSKNQLHEFRTFIEERKDISVKDVKDKLKQLKRVVENKSKRHKKTTFDKKREGEALVKLVNRSVYAYLRGMGVDNSQYKDEVNKIITSLIEFTNQIQNTK